MEKTEVEPEPMKSALEYAVAEGCVIAAAMGNDGANLDDEAVYNYPSRYSKLIAVGAASKNGKRADLSNFGDYKQVMAPGVASWAPISAHAMRPWTGRPWPLPLWPAWQR